MRYFKINTIILLIVLFGIFEITPIEAKTKNLTVIKDSSILSKSNFIQKMREHIKRVERFGLEILKELKARYPSEYLAISEDDVRNYLQLHDKTKLDQGNIADALSQFYGLTREELMKRSSRLVQNGTRLDDLQYTIKLLNKADREVGENFLKEKTDATKEKFRLIEKVADCLDTATHRTHEFAHVVVKASEYFSKQISQGIIDDLGTQTSRLVEIAQIFEEKTLFVETI